MKTCGMGKVLEKIVLKACTAARGMDLAEGYLGGEGVDLRFILSHLLNYLIQQLLSYH